MRDWIVILLLLAGVVFGARQCGCIGGNDEQEANASTDTDQAGDGGDAGVDGGEGAASLKVDRKIQEPDDSGSKSELDSDQQRLVVTSLHKIIAGQDLEDPDGLRAIADTDSGVHGRMAAATLAAASRDKTESWHGLSRMVELLDPQAEDRPRLLQRVEAQARKALAEDEHSVEYHVVGGDSLSKIRGKLRKTESIQTSIGMIQWLNGLKGDMIHPDQVLRAPRQLPSLRAFKSLFLLRVYMGEGLIQEYPIGLGKNDKTPAGEFVLKNPERDVPWLNPLTGEILHSNDPGYAIGTRWIGFEDQGPHRGLGIHGTNEPESIGKAESLGCIRMHNADVEHLADLIPAGARIHIEE